MFLKIEFREVAPGWHPRQAALTNFSNITLLHIHAFPILNLKALVIVWFHAMFSGYPVPPIQSNLFPPHATLCPVKSCVSRLLISYVANAAASLVETMSKTTSFYIGNIFVGEWWRIGDNQAIYNIGMHVHSVTKIWNLWDIRLLCSYLSTILLFSASTKRHKKTSAKF